MTQRTLAIVKPDGVAGGRIGDVLSRIERERLRIVGLRLVHLTRTEAEGFYAVHRQRPFFSDLTAFMSSGPCVVLVLEGEEAIARWRESMGATDPQRAAEGSLRRQFGTDVERNLVHGSDGPDTAAWEISYFFRRVELS